MNNDNKSAVGDECWATQDAPVVFTGMTLRDFFAAAAIQGICANPTKDIWSRAGKVTEAYALADAMIEEHSERTELEMLEAAAAAAWARMEEAEVEAREALAALAKAEAEAEEALAKAEAEAEEQAK
jgi:hypothetical protein